METLWLDYESRSTIPLDERGLDNYAKGQTEIILAAYAFEDRAPKLWQPHINSKIPSDLEDALLNPFCTVYSWNAAFEKYLTEYLLGISKPISEWRDPSVAAKYLSLPGNLEDVGEILGLKDDQAKIKDGKRLIRKFCIPNRSVARIHFFGYHPLHFWMPQLIHKIGPSSQITASEMLYQNGLSGRNCDGFLCRKLNGRRGN